MSNTKIMIVDDSKVDQMIIQNILSEYDTIIANDGIEAMQLLEKTDTDIMILDLNMPRMNGFEVLEEIKVKWPESDMPILILTNLEEIESEIRGLDLGAVDYIRKPLNAASLLKRLEVHLNLLHAKQKIKKHNQNLAFQVAERTSELEHTRDITINALVGLLEVRDIESSNHTRRTTHMMKALCEHLCKKAEYKDILDCDKIEALYKTAPLHDIGKVGVPDNILLKPGKLTDNEYEIMKGHVGFGVDAIQSEYRDTKTDLFMHTALNIIAAHHEKYDGSGYPNGLKGEDIPLEGRLMAIIDVYDALASKRVYKDAFTHEYSLNVIKEDSGKHFDPNLVQAFTEIHDTIIEISNQYKSKKEGEIVEII